MDSSQDSQRVLQTNEKILFKFVFELMAETKKYSNELRGVNIDQSAMCYISMDLS